MKNSFRSISFIIPFLTIILLITFIVPFIPGIENGVLFFSLLVFLIIIIFPLMQGIIRYVYYKKYFVKSNFYFSLKIGETKTFQRVLYYLLVILVLIYPIVGREFNFKNLTSTNIIVTLIFLVLSEIMLYFSFSKTNVNFMKDKILILGSDFRMDLPMGNPIKSNSGIYFYNEFENYSFNKNILTLYLSENDKIKAKLPDDLKPKVIAFLENKKINVKR